MGIHQFRTALLFVTMLAVLAGCSTGNASNEAETTSASGQDTVKKIIVGTGTQFPNVCFIDENGKLTGYDVELIREIDKRLPEYEFEFSTMEFKTCCSAWKRKN